MAFNSDVLGYYGRNIIEDHHDRLLRKLPTSHQQSSTLPPLSEVGREPRGTTGKVGILGAGVGGLYTALMLDSLNVDYEILEASDHAGGRLHTHHFSDAKYDYYDVGAMRFPLPEKENGEYKTGIMKRLGELIDFPGFNNGSFGTDLKDRLLDYYFSAKRKGTYLYYNNRRYKDEGGVPPGFDAENMGVESVYVRVGVDAIVEDFVEPFASRLMNDLETQTNEGWRYMMAHDAHSVRSYLSFTYIPDEKLGLPSTHLSTNVINWCETFDNSTGSYDRALTEQVLDSLAFAATGQKVEWKCFDGGSEVLTYFMKGYIDRMGGNHIHYGKRVTEISEQGNTGINVTVRGESDARTYSHVISTIPLTGLRTIDLSSAGLTVMQSTALRKLEYGASIKVGMRFTSAWWTDLGIVGGQSYTDLPVRMIVYPSYGVDSSTPSTVLIASYCWTADAERLGALINTGKPEYTEELKELVLRDLAKVHDLEYEFLFRQCEEMHAYDWNHDPLTMGAFALFGPGDFQALYRFLTAPNNNQRLHFAGEALSVRHAWVVGALDSAWRAVYEYLYASGQEDKVPEFFRLWGKNAEWVEPSSKYNRRDENNTLLRVHMGLAHLARLSGEEKF